MIALAWFWQIRANLFQGHPRQHVRGHSIQGQQLPPPNSQKPVQSYFTSSEQQNSIFHHALYTQKGLNALKIIKNKIDEKASFYVTREELIPKNPQLNQFMWNFNEGHYNYRFLLVLFIVQKGFI